MCAWGGMRKRITMRKFQRGLLAAGLAVAGLGGAAAAQEIITSTNVDKLKTVFDAAGVAYELKQFTDSGRPYISAKLAGAPVIVTANACKDKDPKGDCQIVYMRTVS